MLNRPLPQKKVLRLKLLRRQLKLKRMRSKRQRRWLLKKRMSLTTGWMQTIVIRRKRPKRPQLRGNRLLPRQQRPVAMRSLIKEQ